MDEPYYRPDLARIHHLGFGFHAEDTAPGVLALLEPVRGGLVVEIGCGSGLLTRHLVGAGHRLIATDASQAMLDIARAEQPDVDFRRLTLPDDLVPEADAIVGVGHALNYLDTLEQVESSLAVLAQALRPGGVLAIDLCDLEWAASRIEQGSVGWVGEDWALVTRFSVPSPDRYVREMTTFTRAAVACIAAVRNGTTTRWSTSPRCRGSSPPTVWRRPCSTLSARSVSRWASRPSSGGRPGSVGVLGSGASGTAKTSHRTTHDRRVVEGSGQDPIEAPAIGNTLQLVLAGVLERETRSRHEVFDRL